MRSKQEIKILSEHIPLMCFLLFVSLTLWKHTDHVFWAVVYSVLCFKGIFGFKSYTEFIEKGNFHSFKKMIKIVWLKFI
jgi:hypothetical protein